MDKNADLTMKIGIFMGGPTPVEEDEEPKEIRLEDYIIIDDTDSDPNSDDDYEDEAGADIMESSSDQNILVDHLISVEFPHVYIVV